jgi:hypothetical protein
MGPVTEIILAWTAASTIRAAAVMAVDVLISELSEFMNGE